MVSRASDPTSLDKMDRYVKKLSDPQIIDAMNRGEILSIVGVGELQRRIEMRKGAVSAPRSTVADDIMGQYRGAEPQQAGIGSLVSRDVASIPREMAAMPRDVASEAPMMSMARGGIVKMAGGAEVQGQDLRPLSDQELGTYYRQFLLPEPNRAVYRLNPDLPPASFKQITDEISRRQYLASKFRGEDYQNALFGRFNMIPLTADDIARQQAEAIPEVAAPPVGLSGPTTSTFPSSTPTSSSMPPAAVGSSSQAAQPELPLVSPGDYPQASQESPGAAPAAQGGAGLPIPPPLPAGGAPPLRRGAGLPSLVNAGISGGAGGAGGMGGPSGMAAGAPGGLPSISGGMAGSPTAALQARMEASDAEYDKVMKEMRENRPNKEQLKEDAKWRFLAELGAGLAAGTGNFARAFGNALGPAMQSYGKEMQSIRKEIQESYKGDLDAYKAKSEALYRSGKLSQDEFHVRMQVAAQLEAARIHAGATLGAASARREGKISDQELMRMLRSNDPEEVNAARMFMGRGRSYEDTAREQIQHNVMSEMNRDLTNIVAPMRRSAITEAQRKAADAKEEEIRTNYARVLANRLSTVMPMNISSSPSGSVTERFGSGS